jgi:hypothetical protein
MAAGSPRCGKEVIGDTYRRAQSMPIDSKE